MKESQTRELYFTKLNAITQILYFIKYKTVLNNQSRLRFLLLDL